MANKYTVYLMPADLVKKEKESGFIWKSFCDIAMPPKNILLYFLNFVLFEFISCHSSWWYKFK